MTTLHYKVSFDRLGRGSGPFDATFDVPKMSHAEDTAEQLADAIWRFAKKRLVSRMFTVAVNLDPEGRTGRVSVEAGRFGSGTVELLTEING